LKDDSEEIRYKKVFEWCSPRFGDGEESLLEFQAARMRNYMRWRIVEDGWTPKYYIDNRVITADHVTRFYGACLAKMFMSNQSINRIQAIRGLEVRATVYRCEERSIDKGTDFWLCNTVKNIDNKQKKIECHMRYHAEIESTVTRSSTGSSVLSDLTDES
jgi:hypothetical protein